MLLVKGGFLSPCPLHYLVEALSLALGLALFNPLRKGQLSLPPIPRSLLLGNSHTRGSPPGPFPCSYFLEAIVGLPRPLEYNVPEPLLLLLLLLLLLARPAG